jgi:hypothetical protein
MTDYKEILLQEVEKAGEVNTLSLAKERGIDHQYLFGAVKSLQASGADVSLLSVLRLELFKFYQMYACFQFYRSVYVCLPMEVGALVV